ncbi:exopolysaccharide biosynthesis polyprenyl glycosylphosphotransferase [Lachnospiraceae bacterium XBB2008]|nr:exopolysaccharide biosynthesis polyprenyl glycosylphosphotransferase [Lachnospiraceae bacterium XBB2008]
MSQKNKIIERYGIWLADLVCILVIFISSTYIRFGNFSDMGDKNSHFAVCIAYLLFCTMYNFFADWNSNFMRRGLWQEFVAVAKYNFTMVLVVGMLMYFMQWSGYFSRLVMGYFIIGNQILTWLVRILLKRMLYIYYRSDSSVIRLLVIAESEKIAKQIEGLREKLGVHYKIVAAVVFDEDMQGQEIRGVPIVANKDNINEVTRQMAIDEMFMSIPNSSMSDLEQLIRDFDEMGIVVHRKLEADVYARNRSVIERFGGNTVITCGHMNYSYKRLLVKRAADIVGGFIGTLITIVLTLFIAPAIKIDSPGPVFFSQIRVGRNGRRFKIYKFRSMYRDAEERKKELEEKNEVDGLMFKMEDDPRITRVGRFLRKTSLDEFPQFLNVLKGDMSLVGTRPPTEDEFEKYNSYYRRRLSMTPGLTGLWQVSGRSDITDFDEVVRLDLEYIDNWSIGLDLRLLAKTVLVVLLGRGSK